MQEESSNTGGIQPALDEGEGENTGMLKGDEDDLDSNIHRRARTTITSWQRQELECLFAKYRYPTFEKVEELSEQLGLPQYVIKVNYYVLKKSHRPHSSSLFIEE